MSELQEVLDRIPPGEEADDLRTAIIAAANPPPRQVEQTLIGLDLRLLSYPPTKSLVVTGIPE